MKHFYRIFIFVIGIALLTGCEEIAHSQNPLVGNWVTTVPLFGVQEIITIQPDNTVYFNNPLDGVRIYSYEIIGDKIELTNLDTGKTHESTFKVIGDYKAIKIDDFMYYPYTEQNK